MPGKQEPGEPGADNPESAEAGDGQPGLPLAAMGLLLASPVGDGNVTSQSRWARSAQVPGSSTMFREPVPRVTAVALEPRDAIRDGQTETGGKVSPGVLTVHAGGKRGARTDRSGEVGCSAPYLVVKQL